MEGAVKTGVVESTEFTSGGAGNQWTYIDGVKYATYWNIRTRDWKVGDTVTFKETYRRFFYNGSPVLHAEDIKKVQPAN